MPRRTSRRLGGQVRADGQPVLRGSRPSITRSSNSGAPAAQACGEQALGYPPAPGSVARVAGERLRQPVREVSGRLEQRHRQPVGVLAPAVAGQAGRERTRCRGATPCRCGTRSGCTPPDPSARVRIPQPENMRVVGQVRDHCLDPLVGHDAAPQQMADVRRQGAAPASCRRPGPARSGRPRAARSRGRTAPSARAGVALQPVGQRHVVPDLAGQPGGAHPGVVGVSLDLAARPRQAGQPCRRGARSSSTSPSSTG